MDKNVSNSPESQRGLIYTGSVPLGVLLIAAFYTFGAIILLVSIFTNPVGVSRDIALAHGLSPTMGVEILVAVATLALVMAYGLFSLSRWGFFLTIAYLIYFGAVNLFLTDSMWTMHEGNVLWAVLVVIYLLVVRNRFLGAR